MACMRHYWTLSNGGYIPIRNVHVCMYVLELTCFSISSIFWSFPVHNMFKNLFLQYIFTMIANAHTKVPFLSSSSSQSLVFPVVLLVLTTSFLQISSKTTRRQKWNTHCLTKLCRSKVSSLNFFIIIKYLGWTTQLILTSLYCYY